jgi:RHS repeat-associated protein
VIAGQQNIYWNAALRLVVGAQAYAACYDQNGNMTCRVRDGAAYLLSYDAENRLTSVSGAASASFVYDGDGQRVKSTLGGVTTAYIGDYFEWTGSTSTMVKYYYAAGQRAAMRVGSSTVYYLLGDHLGSTAITANSSGGEYGELRYKAWGETRFTSGSTPTTYRFTGQREDATIQLLFYNARYYDAALGRFIQADTIVPNPADPQALNRYSYVYNRPCRFTDPSGHCGEENTWNDISADDLSLCYFGEPGHIVGWAGEELKWLAELLWHFGVWAGGQNVFREVFIAGGRGITGIYRETQMDLETRDQKQIRGLGGGPLGITPFGTGLVTIYDAARADPSYNDAKAAIQSTLAHEFIHGLQRAFPEVVSAFVDPQRGFWEYLGSSVAFPEMPKYWWDPDAPKIPVSYAHGDIAFEVMANAAAYAVAPPSPGTGASHEAHASHSWGWDTSIPNYVGLLYELQVTGVGP